MKAAAILVLAVIAPLRAPDREPPQKKENKIVTTNTGLQYLDVKVGAGKEAKAGDTIVCHYVGTFKDGKKFDSSRDRADPFTFALGKGRVIKGWDEGIAGMKEGGTRTLIIPAALAYGKNGMPPVIPPDAELHFEVELLQVK